MKKIYFSPSIEVIETELEAQMNDWTRNNTADSSGTGGGGASGSGGPGGGSGSGGPAAKSWGGTNWGKLWDYESENLD